MKLTHLLFLGAITLSKCEASSDKAGIWLFGKPEDVNDNDVQSMLLGDWGVLKLVDKNDTELYSDFDSRVGNITESIMYSIPSKILGFDVRKWIGNDTTSEELD